jgi:hypothetical protein
MPKMQIQLPDGFEETLASIESDAHEILEESCTAGGKVALEAVRSQLNAVLSPEHKNGELAQALGLTKPLTDAYGDINVHIGFREPRREQNGSMTTRKGKRRSYQTRTNAMIANVLEHGRTNQQARPFLAPARRKCKTAVEDAIQKKFDEEVRRREHSG